MPPQLTPPRKLSPGARVAVVSPSFAAPAVGPAMHEQAMRRIRDDSGSFRSSTRRRGGSARRPRSAPPT